MEFGHISPSPGHIPTLIIVTMVTLYQFNDFFPPTLGGRKAFEAFFAYSSLFFLVDPSRLTSNNVKGGAGGHANGQGP